MKYVERYTNIPVPHVYHYSSTEGDVHSPYILMSKVEGMQLSSVWDDMDDEKRRIVLQQVIDILLEIWSHCFDKNGVLFKQADGGEGKDAWYVEHPSVIESPGDTNLKPTISHSNAVDHWLAHVNAKLYDICNANFGSNGKHFNHSFMWFIRSLIPSLFDFSIDNHRFSPLSRQFSLAKHHDHRYQHIHASVASSTGSRLRSGPTFTTAFTQYPLFVIDHPAWDDIHPLWERNVRDQAIFDELIRETERVRNPVPGLQLSLISSPMATVSTFSSRWFNHLSCSVYSTPFFLPTYCVKIGIFRASTTVHWWKKESWRITKDSTRRTECGLKHGRF